jgi:hypothetical protein
MAENIKAPRETFKREREIDKCFVKLYFSATFRIPRPNIYKFGQNILLQASFP